jgi:glycine dehydrogenase
MPNTIDPSLSPFTYRHIGVDPSEQEQMLKLLGLKDLDDLIARTLPADIRKKDPLAIAPGATETEALAELADLANENEQALNFIGMGYYGTHTPAVIQRNILENPGWYTAYTPYQAEISQGRLEMLLNFQQMIIDLTSMDLANASLLDEGTAAAEAMTMAKRQQRRNKSNVFFVDADTHPQTIAVVRTRARYFGYEVVIGDTALDLPDCFGALIQYPGSSGQITDITSSIEAVHDKDALAIVASDLLALALLKPPGEMGADVVIGSSQRFGVPMGFGGPHAAFFAFRDSSKRSAPGRIIGRSVDARGRLALRMAMQTREQHIRREKATSNICTSQALLAVMAAAYAIYHGPEGIRAIAQKANENASQVAFALQAAEWTLRHDQWFDTLCVETGSKTSQILELAAEKKINLRNLGDAVCLSIDETHTADQLKELLGLFDANLTDEKLSGLNDDLARQSNFLEHPVFNTHHSETEMLRYLRRLEHRDLSLNQAMIPLGSCTMKLNATSEMIPVTWPGFAHLHPFAPAAQTQGYAKLFTELQDMLCACTGYDAISLQPNAGSQGEYAGLLAIAEYHRSRGDSQRDVCLIPESAHGTNPASAQMANMKVVVVKCDDQGNVDLDDLQQKAAQHSDQLAALMVTYPSTHGVFEEEIKAICDLIHQHGGQVYIDGANLNAMVGLAEPGKFGGDVSHLNLHKTFCIPHGGGGPGMGPIGVREHLVPFLPADPIQQAHIETPLAVSSAMAGSAAILPISWMYIRMMGNAGLKLASEVAILSANYIAKRLEGAYPVLYRGKSGLVAHECIIDIRPIKNELGISEEDIAKRLMDYGFHAPTMSFPVPGTLMIEPTESEPLAELNRFCDAMLNIREEIGRIESGEWPLDNNPLVNAPHSLADITDAEWQHPYSRDIAVCPQPGMDQDKYWPPVNRIDNVYGDRNLVCTCPPLSAYQDEA